MKHTQDTYSRVVNASFISSMSSWGPTTSGSCSVPSKCRSSTQHFQHKLSRSELKVIMTQD